MNLFTIGFTGTTAEHFFERLRNAKISKVIDTRLNNVSQLSGFAKRPDLEYFLKNILAITYVECPLLAPTATMLKRYREKQISWEEYEAMYTGLLRNRPIQKEVLPLLEDRSCLLCSEAVPDHCHRRLAAEYIALISSVPVDTRHL